jgi:hypothetical protein
MLTNVMAMGTTWVMALATTPLAPSPSSLPLLSWQPSSLQLPPPQLPIAGALITAIAAAVAITYLFNIAIEQ